MSNAISDLERYLNDALRMAARRIEAFKVDFAADPFRALEANEGLYECAARLHVFGIVKRHLSDGSTVDYVLIVARRQALSRARDPKRSTDPTSNLLDQWAGAAWAEVAAMTGGAS